MPARGIGFEWHDVDPGLENEGTTLLRYPTAATNRSMQQDPLQGFLQTSLARISGKSELAIAIRYTLSRWQALTLVLRDGRACLDNNAA
jgi:hypothetical protein